MDKCQQPDERNTVIGPSGRRKRGSLFLPTVSETYAWSALAVTRVVEKTELNPEIAEERHRPWSGYEHDRGGGDIYLSRRTIQGSTRTSWRTG
jgi:hypothetical protein